MNSPLPAWREQELPTRREWECPSDIKTERILMQPDRDVLGSNLAGSVSSHLDISIALLGRSVSVDVVSILGKPKINFLGKPGQNK
jgi:hypothetical protein